MTRQQVYHFYILCRYVLFFFNFMFEFCHRSIRNIETRGRGEICLSGNELRQPFSDQMRSQELYDCPRDRWELLKHTRQLFFSKENKNPGAECIGTVQMGLQGCSLFTRKRNGALIAEWPLFLGIYFPQLVSNRISLQRPQQQLSVTSAPSKREAGWPLSPCQDVLITWMLRLRAYILERYFYSLSASHTSFSCLLKENNFHLFLYRLLASFLPSCRLSAPMSEICYYFGNWKPTIGRGIWKERSVLLISTLCQVHGHHLQTWLHLIVIISPRKDHCCSCLANKEMKNRGDWHSSLLSSLSPLHLIFYMT